MNYIIYSCILLYHCKQARKKGWSPWRSPMKCPHVANQTKNHQHRSLNRSIWICTMEEEVSLHLTFIRNLFFFFCVPLLISSEIGDFRKLWARDAQTLNFVAAVWVEMLLDHPGRFNDAPSTLSRPTVYFFWKVRAWAAWAWWRYASWGQSATTNCREATLSNDWCGTSSGFRSGWGTPGTALRLMWMLKTSNLKQRCGMYLGTGSPWLTMADQCFIGLVDQVQEYLGIPWYSTSSRYLQMFPARTEGTFQERKCAKPKHDSMDCWAMLSSLNHIHCGSEPLSVAEPRRSCDLLTTNCRQPPKCQEENQMDGQSNNLMIYWVTYLHSHFWMAHM